MVRKKRRSRGLILSREGWQKVQDAKLNWEYQENQGYKITLEEIGEKAGLTTATIRKILTRDEGVDRRSLSALFSALDLDLNPEDVTKPQLQHKLQISQAERKVDWGKAVDVSVFYGRVLELATLERWSLEIPCRLILIIGMGGLGKTALSVKFAQQVETRFERLIWRSLRDAPPIQELLTNLIQFLSEQPVTSNDLPESVSDKVSLLINCLRSSRCLLILDNIESLLCDESRAGICSEEHREYGELFQRLGESEHQSCVLLTSREKPKELAFLEGESYPVRCLQLEGFSEYEGKKILKQKGINSTDEKLTELVKHYNGNPLALKIVATTIGDLFQGDVNEFLSQDTAIFGDIRDVLDQQFQRLLDIEQNIIYWLAINREPMELEQLNEDLVDSVTKFKLLDGLDSLSRRCLIEKVEPATKDTSRVRFTLQSVVMEYATNLLIENVCQEINTQNIQLFRYCALVKATAKDYIKETQIRLIIEPIITRLLDILGGQSNIEQRLDRIKTTIQTTSPLQPGYVAGNILNLLCHLGTDLKGADFSNLCIWQADLQNVCLHNVSFVNADLNKTIFCETFGGVFSVAFSPDGELLASGDSNGDIHLWKIENRQQIFVFKGHTNWVVSLMFSPDGKTLCSGSSDHTVKLWNIQTGICQKTLHEHQDEVWSVVFSPDGKLIATGSDDRTIRIWNINTWQCTKILEGHSSWVTAIAFSPDGKLLASGSDDHTIKLWNLSTSQCLNTFQGHCAGVRTIAFSPDGKLLASGSEDHTIKLWVLNTSECIKTLSGHTNRVFSIAFSPKGDYIATSCHDYEIKLWDIITGECLKTFKEHSGWIFSLAFNPKNGCLASGSYDQTVRLWDINTGKVEKKFQGYSNKVFSVAYSPDGKKLASGSYDSIVRIWNTETGKVWQELRGHNNEVYSVAFHPTGDFLASGSGDKTIKLWNINDGKILRTLNGHSGLVRSISFSPDGCLIASSSEDRTIRLWNFSTGQAMGIFRDHQAAVWSIVFSPDAQTLASCSWDHSIKLWDINTSKCYKTLNGHTNWVMSVSFSPDGQTIISCSADRTLKLWNAYTGECKKTLELKDLLISAAFSPDEQTLASSCQDGTVKLWNVNTYECTKILSGHDSGWIWSIIFDSKGKVLVSGSEDETIKFWSVDTGNCLKTIKPENPYEGLNIGSVTGITEATKLRLKNLGAVE